MAFGLRCWIIWPPCIEGHPYILLGALAALSRWRCIPVGLIAASLAAALIINGAIQTWIYGSDEDAVYWRDGTADVAAFAATRGFGRRSSISA